LERNDSSLLDIIGLTVAYGSIVAIQEVSLKVGTGEMVTLIGANGAGKSTLLKGILGVQRASHGSVSFKGRDITEMPVHRIVSSGISLVPEGRGIVMELTVIENLELGAYHRKDGTLRSLEQVFQQFPILRERTHQRAGLLSGGQQQMLAIGRAMMADPALIMMDEPSLGLAPVLVKQLFQIFLQMKEGGHTILLAEQNARKALAVADRGYVFEKGRVVLDGTCEALMKNERVHDAYMGG
jgi:branched-chain amino acid transport system ATP-binding protein